MEKKLNRIKTITPFYNPGDFLVQCVGTLCSQKYENYEMIFINDCSDDGSPRHLPYNDSRAKIVNTMIRKTALENLHNAIFDHCEPDDIVVIVDGDDWLINKKVLSFINDFYNEHDCWVSYGQARWTDGRRGFASAYPDEESFNNLRTCPFRVSHLRTFRAGLYQKIKEQDPEFNCMKDKDGKSYRISYDVAMMFPIMEMAGFEKVKYNDVALYIYNRENTISDDKIDQAGQTGTHMEISRKPRFKKIENYK